MALHLTRRQVLDIWYAYQQQPWGELRQDYRIASVRQTLMDVAPKGKGKYKQPSLDELRLAFKAQSVSTKPPEQIARERAKERAAIEAAKKAIKQQQREIRAAAKAAKGQ
ncbi:MAG TPA: DUF4035 domain-containing protein [Hymenobacter sp.]|jgi:HAMP domain-containing protein